ncbi:uncharacterized protein F5891DRAFT_1128692 [Suillus fuscotomentosus]|uniref:Uncharacterized protein n=1 Tax=Suillus fuscotomentosus TaxID=1912939 RepID=A0AAD4E566_9AGAM|nr:uncharacterized protein F5891DRAFT_1128692 [Suillus fuscotomentosus]KAG1899934.1 hypothetical protein F5891DRAFT_1128692 [Suillus fuscotomentosus]
MAGRKRAAEDAKVPRTEARKSAKSTGKKGAARLKTGLSATAFKSRAQPLHVNISHTRPPTDVESTDPGFLEAIELVSSGFSTGSFGWKGSKRLTVKLPKLEGEEEGEAVHVMLTSLGNLSLARINATVIGSKGAKEEGEEDEEGEKSGEKVGEKTEEKAEEKVEEKESEGVDEPVQEETAPPAEATEEEAAS